MAINPSFGKFLPLELLQLIYFDSYFSSLSYMFKMISPILHDDKWENNDNMDHESVYNPAMMSYFRVHDTTMISK